MKKVGQLFSRPALMSTTKINSKTTALYRQYRDIRQVKHVSFPPLRPRYPRRWGGAVWKMTSALHKIRTHLVSFHVFDLVLLRKLPLYALRTDGRMDELTHRQTDGDCDCYIPTFENIQTIFLYFINETCP